VPIHAAIAVDAQTDRHIFAAEGVVRANFTISAAFGHKKKSGS
jgi:hypothetical protein